MTGPLRVRVCGPLELYARDFGAELPWCINTGKSLIPLTLLFLHQKRNLLIPLELSRVMHQGTAPPHRSSGAPAGRNGWSGGEVCSGAPIAEPVPRRLVSANLENASRIRAFGSVRIFGHDAQAGLRLLAVVIMGSETARSGQPHFIRPTGSFA